MSRHEHMRMPRRPGFFSAGSWLQLVSAGCCFEAGADGNAAVLGRDGIPAVTIPADEAERCARHADELAAMVEVSLRALCEQLDVLADEALTPQERIVRVEWLVWRQHGSLRTVAAALGELHLVLDELAHELVGPAGGAS